MDPRRASRLRHPSIRLYGEYVWAYIAAIQRAPLSPGERVKCYEYLTQWLSSRTFRDRSEPTEPDSIDPLPTILVNEIVARKDTPLPTPGP